MENIYSIFRDKLLLLGEHVYDDMFESMYYFGDVFGSAFNFGDVLKSTFVIGNVYGLHTNRLPSLKH